MWMLLTYYSLKCSETRFHVTVGVVGSRASDNSSGLLFLPVSEDLISCCFDRFSDSFSPCSHFDITGSILISYKLSSPNENQINILSPKSYCSLQILYLMVHALCMYVPETIAIAMSLIGRALTLQAKCAVRISLTQKKSQVFFFCF